MPTPLTDADKVLRNDTGKDIVEKLDDIAQALGAGVNADQINYNNTTSGLESENVQDAVDEVKEITDNLDNKLDGLTDIISTASGTIATFYDGGDNIPVKSLVTEITAQQAGTGTPSNPLSISGFSSIDVGVQGKNWVTYSNQKLINSVTPTITNGNVKVACSGSSAQFHQIAYTLPNSEKLAGKTITVSYDIVVTSSARVNDWRLIFLSYVNGGSETVLVSLKSTDANHATLNIGNSVTEIVVLFRLSQSVSDTTGDYVTWNKVQLEIGDENTTFEEYTGTTNTVNLGQTIYGGTADVVNGNGTKTWIMLNFSDLNFSASNPSSHIFRGDYNGTYKNNIQFPPNPYTATTCITEHYEAMAWQPISGSDHGKFALNDYETYARFVFIDFNYSTQADFETARNNDKIIVPLINPIPFTFTDAKIPTLSGENNIYSNTGDVSVKYFNSKADWLADLIKAMSAT